MEKGTTMEFLSVAILALVMFLAVEKFKSAF
jgi:hypothetical protein